MAVINIIITDAGIQEVINAEQTGTAPVVLTEVGLGTGQYTPSASQTELKAEFKRLSTIAGGSIGDNAIHLTAIDEGSDSYTVYEFGIYTATGVLFAVFSQPVPILQKATAAHALLAMDIVVTNINPDSIAVGDTNFQLNAATTTKQGIVELATGAEVIAGADAFRAITPSALTARTATTGRTGLVELATADETKAGTDAERVVTPASLKAELDVRDKKLLPLTGGTLTGTVRTTQDGSIARDGTANYLGLFGAGTDWWNKGAYLCLYGIDHEFNGRFAVTSTGLVNGVVSKKSLIGKADGTLTWDGKNVTLEGDCLPLSGGIMVGSISVNHTGDAIRCTSDDQRIKLQAGTSYKNNSWIEIRGKDYADDPGVIAFQARDASNSSSLVARPNGEFKWRGSNIVRGVNGVAAGVDGNVNIDCLPLSGGMMTGAILTNNDELVVLQKTIPGIGDTSRDKDYFARPIVVYDKDGYRSFAVQHAFNADGGRGAHMQMRNRYGTGWISAGLVEDVNGRSCFQCNSSEALLPVGAVFAFACNTAPVGCLLCNGAAVSRTTYKYLFNAIGTTYGAGDGSTTFNLPNLTDRFIQGSGTAGTVKSAGLPNVTGILSVTSGGPHSFSGAFAVDETDTWSPTGSSSNGRKLSFDASRSSSIYGASTTVQPPALTMRYYIKY